MKNRKIIFHTGLSENYLYASYISTKAVIKNLTIPEVHTTQLCFICFDLLEYFDEIYLNHNNKIYNLKLGKNDWISKDLREAHNLFKIVQANILNDENIQK